VFRPPFRDRLDGAERLADALARVGGLKGGVVLGIPRGGVPVAAVVARRLGLPLDVIVAHKVGAPLQPELAIAAVVADGTTVVEPWAVEELGVERAALAAAVAVEIERARAREQRFRAGRPPLELAGRPVVIVDDGIATGATVHAAVLAVRAAGASRVVVAAPVGAVDTVARLGRLADEVVVPEQPDPFHAVGLWYARFEPVDDAEVAELLGAGATPEGAAP
jgi:predicted phosphoribosyltransferase